MATEQEIARKEKLYTIAVTIADMAIAMVRNLKVAYPKKRVFRKIDRSPLKRIKKNQARLGLMMGGQMAAMHVSKIAAQPTGIFPSGRT